MKNIIFLKKETKLRTCFSKAIALVLFIPMLFINSISAQIPFDCKDLTANGMFNFNTNTTYNVHGYCVSVGNPNWSVSNSSTPQFTTISYGRTSITADKEITIGPDFFAGDFNSDEVTGSFEAKINENPVEAVIMEPNSNEVPKYEKLEVGINLSSEMNETIQNYFNNTGTFKNNPFDPDNVNIEATFISPSGIAHRAFGFYYNEFSQNIAENKWNEINTPYHFRIRFSPEEIGFWKLSISVTANGCTSLYSDGFTFDCVNNLNPIRKGYLEVSTFNKRYLRYKDSHDSFFGIGQNITWPIETEYLPESRCNPNDYNEFLGYNQNLGQNQGNLTRIVLNCRWSHGIEFERLGDYRDDENNAPSWELDRYFETLKDNNLKSVVCMQMHGQFTNPLPNSDGHLPDDSATSFWSNNPYCSLSPKNLTIPGIITVRDFFTNPDAKNQFKKYLRYLVARWGYSTEIAFWQIFSELDQVDNYHTNMNDIDNWQIEMAEYTKTLDPKHIISTSYQGQNPNVHNYWLKYTDPSLQIAGFHAYTDIQLANLNFRYEAINGIDLNDDGNLDVGSYPYNVLNKPIIFDETGEWSPAKGKLRSDCNQIEMHNAIWASGFMGCLSTGLEWWQWRDNGFRERTFPNLNSFFGSINFENQIFKSQRFPRDADRLYGNSTSESKLEAITLLNSTRTHAFGWVHNRSYYWGNYLSKNNTDICQVCPNPDSPDLCGFPCPAQDDANCGSAQIQNAVSEIKIRRLKILRKYDIVMYNPKDMSNSYNYSQNSNIDGNLDLLISTNNFHQDWVYKIKRHNESNFRIGILVDTISYDTLSCPIDSFVTSGFHDADSLGTMNYQWNFGNGITSNQRVNRIYYNTPGTYLVTLIVSDTLGFSDTLQEYTVVLDCNIQNTQAKLADNSNQNTSLSVEPSNLINKNIEIFPNPFSDNITVRSLTANYNKLTVFDISGRQLLNYAITNSEQTIHLQELKNGTYILQLTGKSSIFYFKIIKK